MDAEWKKEATALKEIGNWHYGLLGKWGALWEKQRISGGFGEFFVIFPFGFIKVLKGLLEGMIRNRAAGVAGVAGVADVLDS